MKLWKGRFAKEIDSKVNDFNSSIAFDCRMFREDIEVSLAHAEMLGKTGIIPQSDSEKIVAELQKIRAEIDNGELLFDYEAEDIHTFIEAELTKRIGDAGKKLHTARSRNDQVATGLRLYLRREISAVQDLLIALVDTLCKTANPHFDTIMPGYTHLQRAQPVTFGHHLMAYVMMFSRDIARLRDAKTRMDEFCPLGSGALAGTTYPIDRKLTAQRLGFFGDAELTNSIDGVSDRDFCLEIASGLSIIMVHLSRFSEEIILWCSQEFNFIELDDAYSTGSSIMPQKKNPDVAELVRGKAGRVFGSNIALLTVMKGLPLAYNKDMQEDKEAIFDAIDTVKLCLEVFAPMIHTMKINKETMQFAATSGFLNATDCADYLVKKGMPFRDAYRITGELVAVCIEKKTGLENLPLEEFKVKCELFGEDIFTALKLENCVHNRNCEGAPGRRGR
ncbi:MAG: argininosuccinate lyase [Oscillospiraceae bacterium]|nr:argininosuccinate lyase [Oscillospiraceae bacterium]